MDGVDANSFTIIYRVLARNGIAVATRDHKDRYTLVQGSSIFFCSISFIRPGGGGGGDQAAYFYFSFISLCKGINNKQG